MRFLIKLFYIVFVGKNKTDEDISSDSEDEDTTPTNERVSHDDVTPNETINDLTNMKHTLELAKRAIRGEHIDDEDLEDIKEEYSSYFDEESNTTDDKEALKEIIDYLKDEINSTLNGPSFWNEEGVRRSIR